MPHPAAWFFDVVSPYAYLAWQRIHEVEALREVVLKPVVFGAMLKHWGQLGPAEVAPKRVHTYRQVVFLAQQRGVPFRFPPSHPFNPLSMLRLLVALGNNRAAVDAAFRQIWAEGRDANDPAALAAVADAGGDAGALARINDQANKDRLTWNTVQACEAGVFGVPTLRIDGELFWGLDAVDMALAYLDDPDMFKSGELARAGTLPVGVVRTR